MKQVESDAYPVPGGADSAPPADACPACGRRTTASYRFCPACGLSLRDEEGRPLDPFEAGLATQIERERTRERKVVRLWGPATGRIYLLAVCLFTLPDAALLAIFSRYIHRDWNLLAAFLMSDVVAGLLTVFLVRFCAQRGPTGELIMAALRMGQISLVWALRFMPFEPTHDIFNLLLFALLPFACATVAALVFRFHLTTVMDLLSSVRRE